MPDRSTIQYLLRKHLNNTLTTAEHEQLRIVLLDEEQSDECKRVINELCTETISEDSAKKISDDIVDRILLEYPARQAQVITLQSQPSRAALRWAKYAATIILAITSIAIYYYFSQNSKPETAVVQNVPFDSAKQDISPGFNRAVLTLSSGKKVELDSAASETIQDGTLSIENNNGQLIYGNSERGSYPPSEGVARSAGGGQEGGLAIYNTMTTPKGGQYQLTLSDGTRVWLNAASSITYPITFTEKSRTISITGEAYFEVTTNKSKPFIVKTGSNEITVLGTSFNIKSYPNENFKTSLIEGSVKVAQSATLSPAGGSTPRPARGEGGQATRDGYTLKPGEAYLNKKIIKTNIEQDIAWKNGLFNFQNLDVKEAMKQLARWYDVDVVFNGNIPPVLFKGKIRRTLTLQNVLDGLEGMGNLHFKLQGRQLFISL